MSSDWLARDRKPQAMAGYPAIDEYRVPLMSKPPTMNGYVDEEEWKCAAGFDGFSHMSKLEERRIRGYVGATRTHLYIAYVSEMPVDGELGAQFERGTNIVYDDSVELWINPTPDVDTAVTYQVIANSRGFAHYECQVVGNVPHDQWYGWNGNYKFANGFHDGFWHCEIEIPLESVAKGRSTTLGRWSINICRNWKSPWNFSNIGNGSYSPNNELIFTFAEDDCAAIQMKNLTDPTTRDISMAMSIYNPGSKALDLFAQIYLKRDLMPEATETADLSVLPGQTAQLLFKLDEKVSNNFELFATVREKEGDFSYARHYAWGPPREVRWDTAKREVIPVDFKFAYYPYHNRMRILADISSLDESAKLQAIDFTIRPKDGGDPVKTLTMKAADFKDGKSDIWFDMPPLSGIYEIVAESKGTGVPEPLVKQLERHTYEWEHLGLGTSRKVYAPFTPIKAEGNTLHTVMKEYDLNGLGLFDQVRTQDQERIAIKEILAAPMTYTATIDGKKVSPAEAAVEITTAEDDRLDAESTAKLGGVNLSTESTLDYDGLLRVDLTLSADKPTQVDSLDLEIPFRPEVAELMHAMIDLIRYPIVTSAVPGGKGVIWTASEIIPTTLPPNFCTYIFLGNPQRGLCWITENDRGWGWDAEKPNLDLVRADDGTVTLRIHLVNKQTVIDEPRTITFGLQAAPVKPRLEGWRHKWYTDNYSILGCDRHWFALGICGSVYPAGKDMKLWEAIKQSHKVAFSDEEIEAFVEYGGKYFKPYGDDHFNEFAWCARHNLKNRVGTTTVFYYDRSSSFVYDEYQTFLDEWGLSEFHDRTFRGPYEAKIDPSESYIDYALYWYGKSFDVAGNTGVYVDNNYFLSDTNTMMSGAYVMEDGTVRASTGIWGLRELAKRTFVYMNERGMLPINMNHMSTVQILPMNSFYTVQYDWEWKFSEGDVQDRFTREYLLTVTNGEHAGVWPIVLHDNGKRKTEPWNMRTFHAVCAVNEIIVDRYFWHDQPVPTGDNEENRLFYKLRVPISEMCQNPDCEVYRYWDDRPQPVTATNPDLLTIIYSLKGKETIVEVTSYAHEDADCVLNVDANTLGLGTRYTATNMETGESVAVENNQIRFPLQKHDLRQFRLTAVE